MRTHRALLVLSAASLLLGTVLLACGSSSEGDREAGGRTPTPIAGAEATVPASMPTPGESPAPGAAISGPPANVLAVDANPDSADVDESIAVAVGAQFDVAIAATSVTRSYHVYQFKLKWDGDILGFVSGEHLSPDDFTICFGFTSSDSDVSSSCGRSGGGSNYIGTLERLTLRCEEAGTSVLHLDTLEDDPIFGATTFSPTGDLIPTGTAGASVTCE